MPLSGAESVDQGHIYVLTLFSSDPGADAITSWEINWGDDDIQTVLDNPSSVTHIYREAPATRTISATATDEDGTFSANSINVTVNPDILPPSPPDLAAPVDGARLLTKTVDFEWTPSTSEDIASYRLQVTSDEDVAFTTPIVDKELDHPITRNQITLAADGAYR